MTKLFVLITLAASFSFAAEIKIMQKNKQFDKKEISVEQGDVVIFHNDEKDITHNVFSLGPKNAFELKTQAPGTGSPITFNEEGVTEVECAIHPGMKLKVNVKKKKK